MKRVGWGVGILVGCQERDGTMRRGALLMLLSGVGVFWGCSRENTRVDVIDAKAQELVGMVEQNYREWNSMSFMARFEGELLALPKNQIAFDAFVNIWR